MMSENHDTTMLQSILTRYPVNSNLVLTLSLGLALLTLIPFASVYAETITVDVRGESFDIEYTVLGMTVTDITPDLPANSLIIDVNLIDLAGFLTITFDREFFDTSGLGEPFFILIDGDELRYTETESTDEYRTLSIRLPSGSEELEIIGSKLGPDIPAPPPPPPSIEDTVTDQLEEDPVIPDTIPSDAEQSGAMSDTGEKDSTSMDSDLSMDETSESKCGPGTILEDGVCVLDERCGPGTILEDGVCVLASESTQQPTSSKSVSDKGLVLGAVAAFIIAGAIAVFIGLISKAHQRK